jgi:glycosyltransferase involved in cell wall biosynthesis
MAGSTLRILYYNPFLMARDGSGVHAREFVRASRTIGVDLISFPNEEWGHNSGSRATLVGIRRESMPVVFAVGAFIRSIFRSYRVLLLLQDLAKRQKPDVLVQRLNSLDWTGYWLHQRIDLPLVIELNSPIALEVALRWGKGGSGLYRFHEQRCLADANAITVVSDTLARLVLREDSIPKEKIHVNPNGVDVNLFRFSESARRETRDLLGIDRSAPVIGFTGSMKPWHGIPYLQDAFRIVQGSFPDAYLLLIGTALDDVRVNQNIKADQTQGIYHLGMVPHGEIPRYLSACDVCVAPYPRIEPFYFSPIKVIEYMAMQQPVVASAQGQIKALLAKGRGILVEPEDVDGLANALCQAIADPASAKGIGLLARNSVVDSLTWEHNAQRVLQVCEKVVGEV